MPSVLASQFSRSLYNRPPSLTVSPGVEVRMRVNHVSHRWSTTLVAFGVVLATSTPARMQERPASNADELRNELAPRLASTSDSEVIALMIAADDSPLEEAAAGALERIEGAAAVVGLADGKLFAFRDAYGFRPLHS